MSDDLSPSTRAAIIAEFLVRERVIPGWTGHEQRRRAIDVVASALAIERREVEKQISATRAELAEARAALEFYADPDTYFAIMFLSDSPCGEFADDFSEVEPTYWKPGKRARAALAAVTESASEGGEK